MKSKEKLEAERLYREAKKLFPDGIIKKLDNCEFCPYDDILRPDQKKIEVLKNPPSGNHAHRFRLEETCTNSDIDERCYMKYAAMRTPGGDYMHAQYGVVEIFKKDLAKHYSNLGEQEKADGLTFNDAFMEFATERIGVSPEFTNGTKKEHGSYADRLKKIYNLTTRTLDGKEQCGLTELGMYQRIMLDQEDFDREKEILVLLREREAKRHNGQVDIPDKINVKKSR